MKKLMKIMGCLVGGILIIAILIGSGMVIEKYQMRKDIQKQLEEQTSESNILGLGEKRIITDEVIEAKLVNIEEISTSSCEYVVTRSLEYPMCIFNDIPIPFMTNEIIIECEGTVKVGYDISRIKRIVDYDSETIYIALPEVMVLSNDIDMENIKVAEKHSIFNPIEFSQYQELLTEIEDIGLEQVESKGVYEAADKNIRKVIKDALSDLGYQIKFL